MRRAPKASLQLPPTSISINGVPSIPLNTLSKALLWRHHSHTIHKKAHFPPIEPQQSQRSHCKIRPFKNTMHVLGKNFKGGFYLFCVILTEICNMGIFSNVVIFWLKLNHGDYTMFGYKQLKFYWNHFLDICDCLQCTKIVQCECYDVRFALSYKITAIRQRILVNLNSLIRLFLFEMIFHKSQWGIICQVIPGCG